MSKDFSDLIAKAKSGEKKILSVANAQDHAVLEAVDEAHKDGIVDAILVGDEAKIKEIASEIGMNLDEYKIVNVPDVTEATLVSVKYVHDGEADMYMKGIVPTATFLKSVLNKEVGLRTGKTLSHVAVFKVPTIDRLLFLTDVAFLPYPDVEAKKQIINYAVDVARACGVETPKVAPLAAVEVVNPKMQNTVDADELRKLNEAGEIKNCIVDENGNPTIYHAPISSDDWKSGFDQLTEANEGGVFDTLEEAATFIECDVEDLQETVDNYNSYVKSGKDEEFFKSKESLKYSVSEGPYYVTKGHAGVLGALGGVNTNEKLQVLNEDHEVIKNLYATGNNVSGISYGTYQDVEGVGLGFSLTSGRLAGIQAARNAGYDVEDDTTALTDTGKETMKTATERGMNGNLESH